MSLAPGSTIGPYTIVSAIGAGGMGEVYRGIDSNLGRVVAIKVLATAGQSGNLLERFRNEAKIQATLHHPNIVALYDFLELGGRPCIVMEYVDGETIDGRLRRTGPLDATEALAIFEAIAGAVGYLHDRGIVHRDLKAGNIKLAEGNQVKLLDFGLARGAGSPKLTATGHIVGTLEYMAPEQLAQQPADERTDIWALGVILYEMVTGRLPFASTSVGDLMRRIATAEFPPASSVVASVPRGVDAVIAACLKGEPADRVPTVGRLIGMIKTLLARLRRESLPEGPVKIVRTPATNRLVSGAARLLGSHQAVLAAVVLGGFGILATIGLALTRPSPAPEGPVPPPPPPPMSVADCGLATGTMTDNTRSITIDVPGGWADVRCGTLVIGRTPVVITTTVGVPVNLQLIREGFADEPALFTPTSNTTAVQFDMSPAPGPTDSAPRDRGALFALFAWLPFSLFRRKSPPAPAPSTTKATNADMPAITGATTLITVNVLSDIGCVRDSNEDAIGSCRPVDDAERERAGVLLVVADGMGGHSAGEVASRLAVETVIENYALDNGDPQAALARSIRLANRAIHDAAKTDRGRAGMGTTCTALVVRQGWAYCSHVGDSRLYLVRDGAALQMTEDHSAVYDLVKRGVIDREAARAHPDRNVIVRALGSRPDVDVSTWAQPLYVRSGDRFLISSDGLHDLVSDEEIAGIVLESAPDEACRRLIEVARGRGGHDNISAGILAVSSEAPADPLVSSVSAAGGAAA